MIKLCKSVSDSLGKKPRAKAKKVVQDIVDTTKKVRRKQSWKAKKDSSLTRQPQIDTVQLQSKPKAQTKKASTPKDNIGDVYREQKMKHAMQYLHDLDDVAQEIPEASFFIELNKENVVKSIKSMIIKLTKREDKFKERGYHEVVRDEIRARMFLPDADKNYVKVVKAMEGKGYKIADTMAEDANGNLLLDASGNPVKVMDIDVRFGDKAQASGYQDVQIRFKKGKELFELIIMPGPNYMQAADREHKIFDIFKLYDSQGYTKDVGAKEIVNAIKDQFGIVTRKLYDAAEKRDTLGSAQVSEPVTFTEEGIKTLNALFRSLKNIFRGKFELLPQSRRSAINFADTQTARNLNTQERNLREYMDLFKPVKSE